jgi:hypothetical protein
MDRPLVPAFTLPDGHVILKHATHQPELCAFLDFAAVRFAIPTSEQKLRRVIASFVHQPVPRALGWIGGWAREFYKRGVRVG